MAVSSYHLATLSLQDSVNRTALPVIHLIDAMRSGVIDYSFVKPGDNMEVNATVDGLVGTRNVWLG